MHDPRSHKTNGRNTIYNISRFFAIGPTLCPLHERKVGPNKNEHLERFFNKPFALGVPHLVKSVKLSANRFL